MKTQLIVVAAFDRDPDGELLPAFEAMEMPSVEKAMESAAALSRHHDGIVAWHRSADLDLGEFGPPEILALYGEVPEME